MDVWIFGYGSLVWRPDMPTLERVPARLDGFVRRFWQGSPDHRGTHAAPGRVVTLLPEQGACCLGVAYRLDPQVAKATLAKLDHREKAGYQRLVRPLELSTRTVEGLVYYAEAGNPSWLGEAPVETMAGQIANAHGPSGSNRDYLLNLADALAAMGVDDAHVAGLAAAVRGL